MFLPLSVQIRWREDRPPIAVLSLIAAMGLLHLAGWLAIKHYAWPRDWRWLMLALDLAQPTLAGYFTSVFSHADWLHYAGNMLFLWVFGAPLENRLSSARFYLVFVLCGLGSGLVDEGIFQFLQWGEKPLEHAYTLGASGAISGIMGLSAARFIRAKVKTGGFPVLGLPILRFPVPLGWFVGWRIIQDSLGIFIDGGATNHVAHLFGFATGFAVARAFGIAKDGTDDLVWDQARDDMDKGWWLQALPRMQSVVEKRPKDLEALADLLLVQVRLTPPHPGVSSPEREQAAQTLEALLSAALLQGKGGWALAQWRQHTPPLSEDKLSEKSRLLLRQLRDGRHSAGAAPPPAVAQKLYAAPVDADDRQAQIVELRRALEEGGREGRHAGTSAAAFRLCQLEDPREWAPPLLGLAWRSARIVDDKRWIDLAEQAALGPRSDLVLDALMGLERAWSGTPKHPRLAQLLRQAEERLPELSGSESFAGLKARVQKV